MPPVEGRSRIAQRTSPLCKHSRLTHRWSLGQGDTRSHPNLREVSRARPPRSPLPCSPNTPMEGGGSSAATGAQTPSIPWAQHGGKNTSFGRRTGSSLDDPSVLQPQFFRFLSDHCSRARTDLAEGKERREFGENALAPHMHGGGPRAHPQAVNPDSGWQVTDADSCFLGRQGTSTATDKSNPQRNSGTSAPRLRLPPHPAPHHPCRCPHVSRSSAPRTLGPPCLSPRRAKGTRGQGCSCLPWVTVPAFLGSLLGRAGGGHVVHPGSSAGENSPYWKQTDPQGWDLTQGRQPRWAFPKQTKSTGLAAPGLAWEESSLPGAGRSQGSAAGLAGSWPTPHMLPPFSLSSKLP